MPYSETLSNRIREAIADAGEIEEKKMFSSLCFMINDKMCVCVSEDKMMCRVGTVKYEEALENGARPMIHGKRTMKGFVFVNEDEIRTKKDFNYWINLALDFNKEAKVAKRKKK